MHCNIGEVVVIKRLAEGSSKTADCLATMQGKAIQVVCLVAARQRPREQLCGRAKQWEYGGVTEEMISKSLGNDPFLISEVDS